MIAESGTKSRHGALVALVALVCAACASKSPDEDLQKADAGARGDTGSPVPADAGPSQACASGAAAPSDGSHTIDSHGTTRSFILHLPASYDGKRPFPAALAFGGKGDSAPGFDVGSFQFQSIAGSANVLVYMQALPDPQAGGQPSFERDPADDLLYTDAVIAWLKTSVCVDTSRLFAIGHSLGSTFVQSLGCKRGDTFRAVAMQSGDLGDTSSCVGPVSVWIGYGLGDSASQVAASKSRRDFWLKTDECDATKTTPGDPAPPCLRYACLADHPVAICEDPMSGHMWPPWMSSSIFDFFASFSR